MLFKNSLKILALLILLPVPAWGTIIFRDNFDSDTDWHPTQSNTTTSYCYPASSCGMPGSWNAYYNQYNRCNEAAVVPSGRPGNDLLYVGTGAGYSTAYSNTTVACYSGTKCATHWMESCIDGFEDSDGYMGAIFPQQYSVSYLKFMIRFKSGFEVMANHDQQWKVFRIQHTEPGQNPFAHFESHPENTPVNVGGFAIYENNLHVYTETRCNTNYFCHDAINWMLGSVSAQRNAGGILDGNWHSMMIMTRMNTSTGASDGRVDIWIDGNLRSVVAGYNNANIRFNDASSTRAPSSFFIFGNNDNQWDLSSNTMESREQWYAIDDVCFFTDPSDEANCNATGAGSSYASSLAMLSTTGPVFSVTGNGYNSSISIPSLVSSIQPLNRAACRSSIPLALSSSIYEEQFFRCDCIAH